MRALTFYFRFVAREQERRKHFLVEALDNGLDSLREHLGASEETKKLVQKRVKRTVDKIQAAFYILPLAQNKIMNRFV